MNNRCWCVILENTDKENVSYSETNYSVRSMGKLLYSLVPTNSDYLYLGYKGETNRIITAVYYIQNKPTLLLITVAMN